MITLKDIIDLNSYCNIYIDNNISFVDLYNNPDNYIVSDMKVCDGGLELLVYPKDGFSTKYNKLGYVSAGLGFDKLYEDMDDVEEDEGEGKVKEWYDVRRESPRYIN